MCFAILYDNRWNNDTYLSLIQAFADLFMPSKNIKRNDNNFSDDEIRAMHSHTRLLHRKGPWFRVDDLHRRYYNKYNAATHE